LAWLSFGRTITYTEKAGASENDNSARFWVRLTIPPKPHVQASKPCKHWGFCFGHLELAGLSIRLGVCQPGKAVSSENGDCPEVRQGLFWGVSLGGTVGKSDCSEPALWRGGAGRITPLPCLPPSSARTAILGLFLECCKGFSGVMQGACSSPAMGGFEGRNVGQIGLVGDAVASW